MTLRDEGVSGARIDDDETSIRRWLLSADERGNPSTSLDSRHRDGLAWSTGNSIRTLVHGAAYFAELHAAVGAMEGGDLLLFTDWRSDPDELLAGPGSEVGSVFAAAARRGVDVRGLVWRSHLDQLSFSASTNRAFGDEIEAAGGQCLLDMRVRRLGSHHQKFVVLRHARHPERDVAFIGGIDLCHGRRDDAHHRGDPQGQPMAAVYGSRPPWHDVQLAVQGPAVGDAEAVFRERWDDPAPLSRSPVRIAMDLVRGQDRSARPMPPQHPDPAPCGSSAVQLLRTYPNRTPGYPFAPQGEFSVARGYRKAVAQAERLIYVEDQYLWSVDVARVFADALARRPALRLVVVIPGYPDQDGRISMPPNLLGREEAMRLLRSAGGPRVAVYSIENDDGTPVYVHAKVCVIDDTWACVGSDNANRRSWTHDSELGCAVVDTGTDASRSSARSLRHDLSAEHLGARVDVTELDDPVRAFEAFRRSAAALDDWHRRGRRGPRPPGQLRRYTQPALSPWTRAWATLLYRVVFDPDGRPAARRLARHF